MGPEGGTGAEARGALQGKNWGRGMLGRADLLLKDPDNTKPGVMEELKGTREGKTEQKGE